MTACEDHPDDNNVLAVALDGHAELVIFDRPAPVDDAVVRRDSHHARAGICPARDDREGLLARPHSAFLRTKARRSRGPPTEDTSG